MRNSERRKLGVPPSGGPRLPIAAEPHERRTPNADNSQTLRDTNFTNPHQLIQTEWFKSVILVRIRVIRV